MGRPKKKIPGTSNEVIPTDEGINKLKAIKETLPPSLPVIDLNNPEGSPAAPSPLAAQPEKKPISGIFKSIYPLIVDLLCHVANKEVFSDTRKKELLDSVAQDLDELERKYIPETVSNQPGVKALSITGLAIAFQPKAKKEPIKKLDDPQPEPEKKPEPPEPAAPMTETATIPQPAQQPGLTA